MIRLYNSASREIEEFIPISREYIKMYVCGPTVYDTPHLGNVRSAIVFDVLYKTLVLEYGDSAVHYARNFTDVDDKIIALTADKLAMTFFTERNITEYNGIMYQMGVSLPTFAPRASQYIDDMIVMISTLIAKGHAYEVEGNVFFDISSWPSHGLLTGHKQENLESGHSDRQIKGLDLKKNPSDFVLWKADSTHSWTSPWGEGRPGWHIECSAMIKNIFADQTIDIHGGGADLRFPHHECEISQYHAASDHSLARYWVHNAMVTVNGSKMAKSAGNFITVRQLLDDGVPAQAIRLALMMTHYRSPLDWTDSLLTGATKTLTDWHRALEMVEGEAIDNYHAKHILEPLKSDLNLPLVINRIHEKMSDIAEDAEAIAAGVRYAAGWIGLDLSYYQHDNYLRGYENRKEIENLVQQRLDARKLRDWKESDRIRKLLNDMGLAIEDGPEGSIWRRA